MNNKILNQYQPSIEIDHILALPNNKLIAIGDDDDFNITFLLLENSEIKKLDIQAIKENQNDLFFRSALFKTEDGFGCVFDKEVLLHSLKNGETRKLPITNSFPPDNHNRNIGPLRAFTIKNEEEIAVLQEDYFHKKCGHFITKLIIENDKAYYKDMLFSLPSDNRIIRTTDIGYNTNILIHTVGEQKNFERYGMEHSRLYETNENIPYQLISDIEKGYGNFSTDEKYLMIRTLRSPLNIIFYSTEGDKNFSIKLTPKKVLGKVDKHLKIFDAFENRLWLADCDNITEIELYK